MPRPRHISERRDNYTPLSKRPLKAAIYIRVSTQYQVDRDSLPFQRQELENYCKYVLNTDSFVVFEDPGYSAKNTDRPQYQEMMRRIRSGEFTHLLVWKIDRVSRSVRDFAEFWDELREHGVSFISKMEQFDTTTAMGEAMLQIILVFAQLERKLTAERVYNVMISRAEKALWNGAPVSLGYDYDTENKTAVINKDEARLVQQIFDKYEELQSALDVAQWLYESGKQTKRGGKWGSKGVIDVLRNPAYIGIYRWNYRESARGALKPDNEVVVVENALPPIISREQWERVQKLLDSNYKGKRSQQRRAVNIHVLSGLIKCAYCGKSYVATQATRPHKKGYFPSLYRCGTYMRNRQCRNRPISGLVIEPFVLEYLRALVKTGQTGTYSEELQRRLLKTFNHPEIEYINIPSSNSPVDRSVKETLLEMSEFATTAKTAENEEFELMKKRKQKIERAINRLDDAYYFAEGNNAISKTEYLIKRQEFQQELAKIDSEISSSAAMGNPSNAALDIDFFSRFLLLHNLFTADNIREVLPSLDRRAVQDFLQLVIQYVEVADGRVTKICFNIPGPNAHQFIYKQ